MSKHINVNPGQYKVAGREKLGKPLAGKQPHAKSSGSRKQPRDRQAGTQEGNNKR